MKRAQDRVVGARPYAEALREVIADLFTPDLADRFPLLRQPAPPSKGGPQRAALILLTSNRGLAGGFNSNLIKEARRRIEALEEQGYTVDLYGIGKKGIGFFKYLGRKLSAGEDGYRRPADRGARGRDRGPVDRGVLRGRAWHRGAGPGPVHQRAADAAYDNPDPAGGAGARGSGEAGQRGSRESAKMVANYLLAPSAEAILQELLPLYVRNMVYRGLVETAAAEHGARRTAMKNATDNAGEILELLKRTYNRQRQAQITQEISEIVGGAAALQG